MDDYHSSTIAHHDFNNPDHIAHFERGLSRLFYVREVNAPILFVNISYEFDNSKPHSKLINAILNNGFTNMKLISFYLTKDIIQDTLNFIDDHHISYTITTKGLNHPDDDVKIQNLLHTHFTFDNMLAINDIDCKTS
jgi:hypothetical protein